MIEPLADEAEGCCIGAAMMSFEAATAVFTQIEIGHLHEKNRDSRLVMTAIRHAYARKMSGALKCDYLDPVIILDELRRTGCNHIPLQMLRQYVNITPSDRNVQAYIDAVRKAASLRALFALMAGVSDLCYHDGADSHIARIVDYAIYGIDEIRRNATCDANQLSKEAFHVEASPRSSPPTSHKRIPEVAKRAERPQATKAGFENPESGSGLEESAPPPMEE